HPRRLFPRRFLEPGCRPVGGYLARVPGYPGLGRVAGDPRLARGVPRPAGHQPQPGAGPAKTATALVARDPLRNHQLLLRSSLLTSSPMLRVEVGARPT